MSTASTYVLGGEVSRTFQSAASMDERHRRPWRRILPYRRPDAGGKPGTLAALLILKTGPNHGNVKLVAPARVNDDVNVTRHVGTTMRKDEIRVLRDAYKLHLAGTDYQMTDDWEMPIVDRLEAERILEISVVGRILGIRSFRIAPHALPVAKECYTIFENDSDELRDSVLRSLTKLSITPNRNVP